mgnify:CR=1 FL=1
MNQHDQNDAQRRKDDDIRRSKLELFTELQIYQSELGTQNQELREAQQQLEESHNRYANLYDYAPVGYLTVDKTGHIQSINLTGAALLGNERESLIGKPFTACFSDIDHQAFIVYLQEIFATAGKTTIDLKIKNADEQLNFIRLESTVMCDSSTCLMIMSDISQLKKTVNLNRDLLNENRRLMKELFRTQEKERRILACELHDELGQWLTAIRAENEVILNSTGKDSIISISAQAIKECIQQMHEVIRSKLHKLRPVLLDTLGLSEALFELKKQWCSHHPQTILEFRLECDLTNLSEPLNIAVFRLIQECLNNICSHSEATWAQISLCLETVENSAVDFLLLNIEDNGKGYDTNQKYIGLGLLGMRERVIAMDGTLSVRSAHNEGTEINIRLPIENASNEKNNLHFTD